MLAFSEALLVSFNWMYGPIWKKLSYPYVWYKVKINLNTFRPNKAYYGKYCEIPVTYLMMQTVFFFFSRRNFFLPVASLTFLKNVTGTNIFCLCFFPWQICVTLFARGKLSNFYFPLVFYGFHGHFFQISHGHKNLPRGKKHWMKISQNLVVNRWRIVRVNVITFS